MPASHDRIARLMRIIHTVKFHPKQSRKDLLEKLDISVTRFQEDRRILEKLGFKFEWSKGSKNDPAIVIVEDSLVSDLGLTVTEGIITVLALQQICDSGDAFIGESAVSASRKLAGILPQCFDNSLPPLSALLVAAGYGCREAVVRNLETALSENRMVRIHYKSMNSGGTVSWRLVEPLRLHMADSNIYLFAREFDLEKEPKYRIKTFLVSRITTMELTDMLCDNQRDDSFVLNKNNAFRFFMGEETSPVTIRFTGVAIHYVCERFWHHSQCLKMAGGSLLFSVKVADLHEVLRWSMAFWPNAEVLEPEWLREEALHTAQMMVEILSRKAR